jgi:hypothetical protein
LKVNVKFSKFMPAMQLHVQVINQIIDNLSSFILYECLFDKCLYSYANKCGQAFWYFHPSMALIHFKPNRNLLTGWRGGRGYE